MTGQQRRAFVAGIKDANGCSDCGSGVSLTFDHLPQYPKLFDISEGVRRTGLWTDAELLAEIAKCEVVCAPCHNRRTIQRNRVPRDYDEHVRPPVIPDATEAGDAA
jgi:hypothetical protein